MPGLALWGQSVAPQSTPARIPALLRREMEAIVVSEIWAREETPPLGHEIVDRLRDAIGANIEPVRVKRSSRQRPVGNCYWNVAQTVVESDGEAVLGWALMWWPGQYGVAMHHAVWRHPSGHLLDVTEPQTPDRSSRLTTFLPDSRREVDLFKSPRIDNVFVAIAPEDTLLGLFSIYQSIQPIWRQIIQLSWDHGYRNETQFARARGITIEHEIDFPQEVEETYVTLCKTLMALEEKLGSEIVKLVKVEGSRR